tara:strand:+ start:950 stop:1204 length:255 start_codon:yes stop_codon:yes gene_type:complete
MIQKNMVIINIKVELSCIVLILIFLTIKKTKNEKTRKMHCLENALLKLRGLSDILYRARRLNIINPKITKNNLTKESLIAPEEN